MERTTTTIRHLENERSRIAKERAELIEELKTLDERIRLQEFVKAWTER